LIFFAYIVVSVKVYSLLPFLFAIYVDDLMDRLNHSGRGIRYTVWGTLFIGCILYADDIALLSSSCFDLQKVVNICAKGRPHITLNRGEGGLAVCYVRYMEGGGSQC